MIDYIQFKTKAVNEVMTHDNKGNLLCTSDGVMLPADKRTVRKLIPVIELSGERMTDDDVKSIMSLMAKDKDNDS